MAESVQYIRCLMERASKRKESDSETEESKPSAARLSPERATVKPFRGGVLFFHCIPDATGERAAWGIWKYFYTPYLETEGSEPDVLRPPNYRIKKRDNCFVTGPMRQGVFFNREFIDRRQIGWLKSYCEKNSLGVADLDGFNLAVLLFPQSVGWSQGHYLYDRDSPKLICALDFENQISRLAYGIRYGRNTRYDRLGYASKVYELCPCESRRRAGENVKLYDLGGGKRGCYHRAEIKIKHLGEVIAVSSRRHDSQHPSVKFLQFLPLDQFFQALSINPRMVPNRPTELTPRNIGLWFAFLDSLHKDYIDARRTFESYKLDIPIWRVYSGGSIARAVLHNLSIAPFRKQNPHISAAVLSKFRAADCGGRICTMKTGKVIPAAHLDFKSQYPAVSLLLGLQDLLMAERIDVEEMPVLPAALRQITFEKLLDRLTWLELRGIALVKPNKDWLPFHGTLGLECRMVESGEPFWVTLADIAASVVRTGKVPEVVQSIVLKPSGIQDSIRPGQFFSVGERNPL